MLSDLSRTPPAEAAAAGHASGSAPVSVTTAARRVVGPFVVTRLFILLIASLSTRVLAPGPWLPDGQSLLDLLIRWDANWYLNIVQEGYRFTPGEQSNVAFFPLYPLIVRALAAVMDPRLAGYLVSHAALFLGAVYLYRLVTIDYADRGVAERTVWFLFVAPMSFYFSTLYTESLFFLLVVASFYHARRRDWLLAGACAALASATRSLGVLLVVPLTVEYLELRRGAVRGAWRRLRPDALFLLLVPLGLIGYMTYLQIRFGDALAFLHASRAWYREFVFFTQTLWRGRGLDPFYMVLYFGATVIVLGVFWLAVRQRLRASYSVFFGLFVYFNLSTNLMDAVSRYFSVIFPLYLGLALAVSGSPFRERVVNLVSITYLTLTTIMFANGYWMT